MVLRLFQKIPLLRQTLLGLFLISVWGCHSSSTPSRPGGLQVGDKLLDFSLMDENGRIFELSKLDPGWYLVVVLYRGSYCNACRTMLLDLKDDGPAFVSEQVAIAAISTDSTEDSSQFNSQWRFPFPLLSDPALKLIDAFGARHPNGHGIYDIAHPAIIVIDPQKTIRYKKIAKNPDELPGPNEILFLIKGFKDNAGNSSVPSPTAP